MTTGTANTTATVGCANRGSPAWRVLLALAAWLVLPAAGWAAGPSIFDDDWSPPKRSDPPVVNVAPPKPAKITTGTRAAGVSPTSPSPAAPVLAAPPSTPAVAARRPLPAKVDQAKSRKLMREVYAAQLADRSAAGRRKLAADLLAEAGKVADNPTDQFVLLGGAIEAAREAGMVRACLQAADAMAQTFDVDALALKADAAARTNLAAAGSAADNVQAGVELVDQLMAAEDYAAALRLCSALQPAAAANPSLRADVQQRTRDATAARAAQERLAANVARLRAAPDDPAASLVVGSYLCFTKGDWPAGLPLLAAGSNPLLKAAAAADVGSPTAGDGQAAAGDAWWASADREPAGPAQAAMRLRASTWYQAALSGAQVTGLNRVRLEKRVAEVPKPDPSGTVASGTPAVAAAKVAPHQPAKPAAAAREGTLALWFKGTAAVYVNGKKLYEGEGNPGRVRVTLRAGDAVVFRLTSKFVWRGVRYVFVDANNDVVFASKPADATLHRVEDRNAPVTAADAAGGKPASVGRPDGQQDAQWTDARLPPAGEWVNVPERGATFDLVVTVPNAAR